MRPTLMWLLPLLLLTSVNALTADFVAPTNENNAALIVDYSPVNVTSINISTCNLNLTYFNTTTSSISMTVTDNFSCFYNMTNLPLGLNKYLVTVNDTSGVLASTSQRTVSINKCGLVNASLTLTANVNALGTCFILNTSGITFDCNNFTVTGPGSGDGISVTDLENVVVRNCFVNKFARGISTLNTNYSVITQNYVYNNSIGISAVYSYNDTIGVNDLNVNAQDFQALNCLDNTYYRNLLHKDSESVSLVSLSTNTTNVYLNSVLVSSPFPFSYENGSGYLVVTYSGGADDWIVLTQSYSEDMQETAIKPYIANGVFWTPITNYTQDTVGNSFSFNLTGSGTYAIIGCSRSRALVYGDICYAYINLQVDQQPANYVIGDIVTLMATLSDQTLAQNITRVDLYYADINGTNYNAQSFLYNPVGKQWFTPFKVRQKSEFLQAMAIDNSSGKDVVIGYGSFYLYEQPPLGWSDWFVIYAGILLILIVLWFGAKWAWEAI